MTTIRVGLAVVLIAVAGAVVGPSGAGAQPCPQALRFEANPATSTVDFGWTGFAHGTPLIGATLTMGAGCVPATPACSSCALSGPIPNAAGYNQRCRADTSIVCAADADCGAGGSCDFFLGPPQPISVGGVGVCLVNQLGATLTGTLNAPAGDFPSLRIPLAWKVHLGGAIDQPCPRCVGDPVLNDAVRGGTCDAGLRQGLGCDGNAASPFPDFGVTSFDCPLNPFTDIGALTVASVPLASSTGGQSVTLSTANPLCTAFGYGGQRCFCQTCATAAAEPCFSDADCGGAVCGGLRCFGGATAGTPCSIPGSSDPVCGGSPCGVPGEPTKPNGCNDNTAVPGDGTICIDTVPTGDHAGECSEGPFVGTCAAPEDYRSCGAPIDCPITATCTFGNQRCYPQPGGTVSVAGDPDPPVGYTAQPTLGALYCLAPMTSAAANGVAGFPGLGRLTMPGTLTLAQEIASRPVAPGGSLSTGSTPSGNDPIETTVVSPASGPVAIFEQTTIGSPPVGFSFVNQQVDVTAPPASAASPLVITFLLHYSRLTAVPGSTCGAKALNVEVSKDGAPVPDCVDVTPPPHNTPPNDPTCVAEITCPGGNGAANGNVRITVWTTSASVWRFAVPEAAAPIAIAGKKLQLKDNAKPSRRKLVLQLRDENLVAPTPGDVDDPTCAGAGGGGAMLDVFGTGGSSQYVGTTLPCENWTVLGKPADAKGYKYKDSRRLAGPCKSVIVKNRKVTASKIVPGQVKAVCDAKNPAWPLDYDLGSGEGSVGVTFRMGSGVGYCVEFGGTVKKDDDRTFQAQDTGPPGVCPVQ